MDPPVQADPANDADPAVERGDEVRGPIGGIVDWLLGGDDELNEDAANDDAVNDDAVNDDAVNAAAINNNPPNNEPPNNAAVPAPPIPTDPLVFLLNNLLHYHDPGPDSVCAICTEPYALPTSPSGTHEPSHCVLVVNIPGCKGHHFHQNCMLKMMTSNMGARWSCPYCRTKWVEERGAEMRGEEQRGWIEDWDGNVVWMGGEAKHVDA